MARHQDIFTLVGNRMRAPLHRDDCASA